MSKLKKIIAAGLFSFSFVSFAAAAESEVLRSAGLAAEAVPMPEVPAPPAEPAAGSEAKAPDIFRYFGRAEAPRAEELFLEKDVAGADRAALYSVKLETIKNVYLKPAITFTTAAGTKVHVSGTKAANCPDGGSSCEEQEKFFLVLTTARNESYFVRGTAIINWGILYSGSKTVAIDGENYVVRIYADATSNEESILEVKGPRGVAVKTTIKKLGDAVTSMGVSVKLSRAYKLAYGNEIVQGPQGARFTSRMLLLMMPFPVQEESSYYIFNASDIKPSGAAFPAFERGYSFRLQGGILDISKI